MKVTLIWVGEKLLIKGTTNQVAYISQEDNGKWGGIVLGMEGKGVIDNKSSRDEVEKAVTIKLLHASKCKQYRSTINGRFLKTR